MTEHDEYPPCNEPHDWVIFVSGKTTDEMRDMGKILGANGFTGTFHDGPLAHHMRLYKNLRVEHKNLCAEYEKLRVEYEKLLDQVKGGE